MIVRISKVEIAGIKELLDESALWIPPEVPGVASWFMVHELVVLHKPYVRRLLFRDSCAARFVIIEFLEGWVFLEIKVLCLL